MEATLCHCGRHKDRCRCAGRREALEGIAAWCEAEAARARSAVYVEMACTLEDVADHVRALANGAP